MHVRFSFRSAFRLRWFQALVFLSAVALFVMLALTIRDLNAEPSKVKLYYTAYTLLRGLNAASVVYIAMITCTVVRHFSIRATFE
jgi:hypothetical protein